LAHKAGLRALCVRALCSQWQTSEPDHAVAGIWSLASVFWFLASGSGLLLLTAFNHPQGLGIAAFGITAVVVWRLIEWKRSALWWMIAGTLFVNTLFLWLYPRPAIIETYRGQGWLNAWYGFNILDLSSPAGDRMLQIVSVFGLVNLAASFYLLRLNHAIAWLTFVPLLSLSLPLVAIPFAWQLNRQSEIVAFHRMLFAYPFGLALSCMCKHILFHGKSSGERTTSIPCWHLSYLLPLALSLLVCTSPSTPLYNRGWQLLERTPNDLQFKHICKLAGEPATTKIFQTPTITTHPIGQVLLASGISTITYANRWPGGPFSYFARSVVLTISREHSKVLLCPLSTTLNSAGSIAGLLAAHWPPQQVAFDSAGSNELEIEAVEATANQQMTEQNTVVIFRLRDAALMGHNSQHFPNK